MRTKIILELCCNHQGSINIAKQMIDDAHLLGAWGVKLQKRDVEAIPDKLKNTTRSPLNSFGGTFYEHRKALEFSVKQMLELKEYIESKKMRSLVSVFDELSAKQMLAVGYEYIKLPSQLYSNENLVKLISDKTKKLIGSTGMHTLNEISEFKYNDCYNILFFCRSLYPCNLSEIKLGNFLKFKNIINKQTKKTKIGYSSHDIEGIGIKYAVLLGAEFIERHYTMDKTWIGSDHSTVSSDFEETQKIIKEIEYIETVVKIESENLDESEKKIRLKYRGF